MFFLRGELVLVRRTAGCRCVIEPDVWLPSLSSLQNKLPTRQIAEAVVTQDRTPSCTRQKQHVLVKVTERKLLIVVDTVSTQSSWPFSQPFECDKSLFAIMSVLGSAILHPTPLLPVLCVCPEVLTPSLRSHLIVIHPRMVVFLPHPAASRCVWRSVWTSTRSHRVHAREWLNRRVLKTNSCCRLEGVGEYLHQMTRVVDGFVFFRGGGSAG